MEFRFEIDIAAPPDVVWAVMSDVERWHEWTPSVTSIRLFGGGPLRLGARALVRQPKFPPALWKVTSLDPGRSFTWTAWAPGMRVHGIHSVDPVGAGSRAVLVLRYEGWLGGLFARLTREITQRYIRFEGEGLKRRSEARGTRIAEAD